jgi:chemotaxis-related protein WspD
MTQRGALQVMRPDSCWRIIGVAGDGSCPELNVHVHCRNCPVFSASGRALMERPPPPGYVEEWTEFLAGAKLRGTPRTLAVLVFRIGDEWLAIDAAVVAEIAEVRPAHRIAHRAGPVLTGLVNIRGQLHLMVSLHGLLRIEPPPPEASREPTAATATPRLVVIQRPSESWVFRADEVQGVQRFAAGEIEAVPVTVAHAMARVSRGILPFGERRVGYLDGDALFTMLRQAVG